MLCCRPLKRRKRFVPERGSDETSDLLLRVTVAGEPCVDVFKQNTTPSHLSTFVLANRLAISSPTTVGGCCPVPLPTIFCRTRKTPSSPLPACRLSDFSSSALRIVVLCATTKKKKTRGAGRVGNIFVVVTILGT